MKLFLKTFALLNFSKTINKKETYNNQKTDDLVTDFLLSFFIIISYIYFYLYYFIYNIIIFLSSVTNFLST